jgi:uncharacterized protein YcbK (DUF882 family)
MYQFTKNFNSSEFRSPDTNDFPRSVFGNLRILATNLQVLRDHIKKPIKVNSGYRTHRYNSTVKNAVPNSRHCLGQAVDISVNGISPKELARIIVILILEGRMQEGGIGLYRTFVHYDIRGTRARWTQKTIK